MHKIRFRLGLCPRPHWGAYSAPPCSPAGFKGLTSKGREGNGGRERRGKEGVREGREGGEKEKRGKGREVERKGEGKRKDRGKKREGKAKDPHCFLDKSNPE